MKNLRLWFSADVTEHEVKFSCAKSTKKSNWVGSRGIVFIKVAPFP